MAKIFGVLCALFKQIPFGMNRDILKVLPYAELEIVTNSVYLVIWSRGFRRLLNNLVKGSPTENFLPSYNEIGPVVSDKTIFQAFYTDVF